MSFQLTEGLSPRPRGATPLFIAGGRPTGGRVSGDARPPRAGGVTPGETPQSAMQQAAGAGGAGAGPQGGALCPDRAASGRSMGSGGPWHLPVQSRGRGLCTQSRRGDSQAESLALDVPPDVFVVRVLLEETGETFEVKNCRGDTTVRELKEELDMIAGIPMNLLRLQYLDQGGPLSAPPLTFCAPSTRGARSPSEPATLKGCLPSEHPQMSKQTSAPWKPPMEVWGWEDPRETGSH